MSIHLKNCLMSVFVGVNGTVNGRSVSSPTGNSAVDTTSFPSKGNRRKPKASSCVSQKSSPDLGQLQQKTKEKVNISSVVCPIFKIHLLKVM